MYCFEAFHCEKDDCPVRRRKLRRCWEFLQKDKKEEITKEDCAFAPCSTCHYHMGWEIGLISDNLFSEPEVEEIPDLIPEIPEEKTVPETEAKETRPDLIPSADREKPSLEQPSPGKGDLKQPPFPTDNEVAPPQKEGVRPDDELITPPLPEEPPTTPNEIPTELKDSKIGSPGMRFCWEVVPCTNPRCPVRERRIIRCFKFFEPKGEEEKNRLTCSEISCENCHYKRGWDLGIINEDLFADFLEERRQKMAKTERLRKESIVEVYLQELAKKPLSRDEEIALAKRLAGDRQASELLLTANLKLVVRIAGSYSNRGLNLMDLIQEGNLGLIRAIAKFDYTLGYRFSTYAAYWIRHYMQKAISGQARTVRVPHHLLIIAHKIKRTIRDLEAQQQRPPTLSELSKILMIEEDKIVDIIRLTQAPISIEAQLSDSDDEETPLEYFLADKRALSPEEEALEKSKIESCRKALELLPERLRDVVELFYGFRDEQVSLAEIGRRMGITRERARQLLKTALEELHGREFVMQLKDYL